jgi:hypothetical protein
MKGGRGGIPDQKLPGLEELAVIGVIKICSIDEFGRRVSPSLALITERLIDRELPRSSSPSQHRARRALVGRRALATKPDAESGRRGMESEGPVSDVTPLILPPRHCLAAARGLGS